MSSSNSGTRGHHRRSRSGGMSKSKSGARRSQDTSGGVLGMLNPTAGKSIRELVNTNPSPIEGAERLGPGYGSEQLYRIPISAFGSDHHVTSKQHASGQGRRRSRSRSNSLTPFQLDEHEHDSDENEVAAAAAVGRSAPGLRSASFLMSPSASVSSSSSYVHQKAASSAVPTVATSACTTPTTFTSSRASTSVSGTISFGAFAGIGSSPSASASSISNVGDVGGYGYDRNPDTDAAIDKYSRDVFFFLSQNKALGNHLAEFIVPKLRGSDWIMRSRGFVVDHGPDGTINYSDDMFSAQIERYDDMVDMVTDQCSIGCGEARAALRKIIMAFITDSVNPYGQNAGRDDGRMGKDDGSHCSSDSRASGASSLGRRSFSELEQLCDSPAPASVRRRASFVPSSLLCGDEDDTIHEELEVPRYIAVNKYAMEAANNETDFAGVFDADMSSEDEDEEKAEDLALKVDALRVEREIFAEPNGGYGDDDGANCGNNSDNNSDGLSPRSRRRKMRGLSPPLRNRKSVGTLSLGPYWHMTFRPNVPKSGTSSFGKHNLVLARFLHNHQYLWYLRYLTDSLFWSIVEINRTDIHR